ncbi:hypothetical protein GCM10027059_08020 [Myceligenerans halotolerans]
MRNGVARPQSSDGTPNAPPDSSYPSPHPEPSQFLRPDAHPAPRIPASARPQARPPRAGTQTGRDRRPSVPAHPQAPPTTHLEDMVTTTAPHPRESGPNHTRRPA